MRIDTDFTISRPPREAYALLLDLERVAPCFPGAELVAELPDGGREVRVTVRLGPMRLVYEGEVRIAEQDDDALRAVLAGDAREARGAGSAGARIAMRVEPAGDGSRVIAEADVDLTGRAAQMGRGIVEDMSRRLVADMAGCLEASLEAAGEPACPGPDPDPATPPAPAPLQGGRLALDVARDRLRDPRLRRLALVAGIALALRIILGTRRRSRDA